MAEKKVDIVLEALFRDRDNAFAKAKRSQLELVREQRTAQAEMVSQQRTALREAEDAERDSLDKRLTNLQRYYSRRIQLVRSHLYEERNKEAELFAEVEKARTEPLRREEARLEKNRAKHVDHLQKRVAAEREAAEKIQQIRQQALSRETDQFLAARFKADAKADEAAARRASERQIRESTGGAGSSRFRLQREADRINASIREQQFGGGAANEIAGVFRGIAKIRLALDGVKLVTKLWKGDLEGAAEDVQELPYGIGAVAKSVKEIMMEWSGANEEIAKHNKAIAELEERGKRIEKATVASDQLNAMLRNLRLENIEDPFEQEMERARRARDEALAEVERIRKEGGDKTGERSAEARARIQREFRQEEEDIRHRQAVAKDAEEQAIADAKERREKERKDAEKSLRDQGRREAQIESEIRQMQLRALGKDLDAQLEAIRSHFAERIAEAKTDRERLLLEQQQALAEEEAAGGANQRPGRSNRGVEALQLSERFLGLRSGGMSEGDKAQIETARTSKDILATARQQAQATNRVAQAVERLTTSGTQPQIVSL